MVIHDHVTYIFISMKIYHFYRSDRLHARVNNSTLGEACSECGYFAGRCAFWLLVGL